MFALLPWPFIQRFIRRAHLEANRVQQGELDASAKEGVDKPEIP